MDTRISTAAERGRLRVWKRAAAKHYAQIDRLLDEAFRPEFQGFMWRGETGRRRILKRLQRRLVQGQLHDVRLTGNAPLVLWSLLRPRDAVVVDPCEFGQAQDCVVVEYVLFGAVRGPNSVGVATGLWGLEVSDHALVRLLQRDPQARLAEVLFAAHHAMLSLPLHVFEDSLRQRQQPQRVLVSAGAGVFVCDTYWGFDVSQGSDIVFGMRARTWLHDDQLRDEQQPAMPASLGQRAGESQLLPSPLRKFVPGDSFFEVVAHPWVAGFGMQSPP